MIKWLSNILTRAGVVKNELVDSANSAPRIGQLFEDLAKIGVTKFDPAVAYETGQYAIYNGVLAEVITDTTAGQTPDSHPLKWSLKLVIDPAQITVSNNLPVAASAIAKRIAELAGGSGGSVPNATTTTAGKVRQATADEAKAGVVADAYITPKHMHDELTLVLEEYTKPTLATVTENGATTSKHTSFLGGLSLDNVDPTTSIKPVLVWDTTTKKVMTGPVSSTGTGGGAVAIDFNYDLMKQIAEWSYAYAAAEIEKRTGDALPPLPSTNSTVAIGKVNAVFIQLDDLLGAIPLANCSNGDNFELRIIRRDQGNWTNGFFYDAERFDGTTANGSYRVLDPYGKSRYGFLTAGLYTVQGQPKGNTSASAVVSQDFEVKAVDIVPRSDFRIVGEPNPVAGAQNVPYVLQQFYSDGLWKNYSGTPVPVWVLDGAPAQVGISGGGPYTGFFSSEASAITSDDQIIVRAHIGINIDFPITLKPATSAPTVLRPINQVFGQDVAGVGRIGLANVTEAVKARRIYEKPLGTFYGGSDWQNAELIGGSYGEAGATVQVIWPAGPTEAGTYYFKDQWESIVRITGRPYETAQLDIYSKTIAGGGATTTPVFAYAKFVLSSNSFEVRAAPAAGPLTVTLTQYPTGYSNTAQRTMSRFDTAPLYGQSYNWLYTGYTGLLFGQYVIRFNFPNGVVKYSVLQTYGADQEMILTLFDTEPTVTNTGSGGGGGGGGTTYGLGNLYEGVPIASTDSVTRAIYRRQNGNYSPPRLVNISARTNSLATMQVAYRLNGITAALTDSDWTDMTTTGTFQDTNQSATKTYLSTDTSLTVYLRPKSSPLAIKQFTVPLPGEETTYTVATLTT